MDKETLYKPAGFKDSFTRLFSVITIMYSILFFTEIMDPIFDGYENFNIFLLILGLHGIVSNPHKAGQLRKLLCHISGAAATVLMGYSIIQLFIRLGLVL